MILFLHNRYRTTGGEERAIEELRALAEEQLGEETALLERDSADLGRARAALGLLHGGLQPDEVAAAVRRSGADVVHAHNLLPALGPRALRAARAAGARVVLHLHNYRLVCAVATCVDPAGADCTRCHGRDTRPGVRKTCRGSLPEAAVYAVALARHQRALTAQADAVVVPSAAARDRLHTLGAPLDPARVQVVGHVVRDFAGDSGADRGSYALVAGRLAPEKGVEVAIDACRAAGLPLVVAGDGPLRAELEAHAARDGGRVLHGTDPAVLGAGSARGTAAGPGAGGVLRGADTAPGAGGVLRGADTAPGAGGAVLFTGHVDAATLARLRAGARVAAVPSRAAETYGLAAVEALAAGVPVVASRVGALAELDGVVALVPPGDVAATAAALTAVAGDAELGRRGIAAARERAAPDVVAPALAEVYAAVRSFGAPACDIR